jgi:hypothetical protein
VPEGRKATVTVVAALDRTPVAAGALAGAMTTASAVTSSANAIPASIHRVGPRL